ncbi:helix-turn-helix domain-containing protein [Paenibacillus elgii]
MIDKKKLGAIIKQHRKEKNLRQIELSTKTSLSRNYISDIENGRYAPSLDALVKLAVCVDLDLNSLKMTEIQGVDNAI